MHKISETTDLFLMFSAALAAQIPEKYTYIDTSSGFHTIQLNEGKKWMVEMKETRTD